MYYKGKKIGIRIQNGVLDDERNFSVDADFYSLPKKIQDKILSQMNFMVENNHSLLPYGWQKKMAKKILITGATGLVGTELKKHLLNKGYEVNTLSRKKDDDANNFVWDVYKGTIEADCLNGVDAIIHLAGEPVADKKWTDERKKQIIDSRVKSAELIFNAVAATNATIESYISASAVGIYGDRADEILDEESLPGTGFMADCCLAWEKAADKGIAFELWLMLGGLLAAPIFASSAISIPLLLDKQVKLWQAVEVSWRCVLANPGLLASWAAVLMLLTLIGMATFLVGLIIVIPVLGHASWHAYKELIDSSQIPSRQQL